MLGSHLQINSLIGIQIHLEGLVLICKIKMFRMGLGGDDDHGT